LKIEARGILRMTMAEADVTDDVKGDVTDTTTTEDKGQETTSNTENTESKVSKSETVEDLEADKAKGKEPSQGDYWPKDWREKVAEHASAGNEKAYARELKRLARVTDPSAIYGNYREAESKISSNKAIFKPDKNASEEDVAAYHKSLGVPDKPADYLENLALPNGETIGDDDKEVALEFADDMHKAGASQDAMNAALNWYYARQEDMAAFQDENDDRQKYEAEVALKEEYGAAYKRKTAGISSLFTEAPGGADVSNPDSLYARLVGGRLADGTLIGNDPDMVRWLSDIAGDVNPAATTLPDGMGSGKSIAGEIAEIEKIMRTNKREYFKNHAGRYAELLEVRQKMRERGE